MRLNLPIIICFFFSIQAKSSDFIFLKDGNSGAIIALDTTGNLVTYSRQGNKVTINKAMVNYLVIDNDTINYNDFKPIENAVHDGSSPINRQFIPLIKNDKSNFMTVDNNVTTQISRTEIKKGFNDKLSKQFKFMGCLQISGAVINEILVICDATRTESASTTIGGKTYTANVKHEWAWNHTMLSVLNGLFLVGGITLITITF